jgi:hypothetical protein
MLIYQNSTLTGILISPSPGVSMALLYHLILQNQPFLKETRAISSFGITLFNQLDFRKKKTITAKEKLKK